MDDAILIKPAFELANKLGHPIYDCLYLVAAQVETVQLITSDATFVTKLAGTPFERDVVLLADWQG